MKEFKKISVNLDTMKKKFETYGFKYKDCNCFFVQINFKDDLLNLSNLYVYNENYKKQKVR